MNLHLILINQNLFLKNSENTIEMKFTHLQTSYDNPRFEYFNTIIIMRPKVTPCGTP